MKNIAIVEASASIAKYNGAFPNPYTEALMAKVKHICEFDSLRAIAAMAVMAAHFMGSATYLLARIGWPGVVLFFCLSGYLITGILLECSELKQSPVKTLGRFYIRRALRIFPLYYLAVILFAIFVPAIRDNLWWFLLYAANIGKSFGSESWMPLNHFWTLAVEEQFYIIWPFIVLFAPRKWLMATCAGMFVFAFVFRLSVWNYGFSAQAIQQLTPSCVDALGMGAFFAVAQVKPERNKLKAIAKWLAIVFSVVSIGVYSIGNDIAQLLLAPTVYSLSFSSLLYLVAINSGSPSMWLLRLAPLLFLGQISYGLYVWHLPVMWGYRSFLEFVFGFNPHERLPFVLNGLTQVSVLAILTVLVSVLSWLALERPINNLKSRYPYKISRNTE
jgi:peptidoglycan/LPS O-acetylase OafA/YrhL